MKRLRKVTTAPALPEGIASALKIAQDSEPPPPKLAPKKKHAAVMKKPAAKKPAVVVQGPPAPEQDVAMGGQDCVRFTAPIYR